MRAALFGLLATAAFVSATETRCLNNNLQDLLAETSCGCPKKLSKCLSAAVNSGRSYQIQQCFIASGCEEKDAITNTIRIVDRCQGRENSDAEDELRKRRDKESSAPSIAEATTTSDDPATTPASTASITPASTTSDFKTISVRAENEITGSPTSSLQCSVTKMITTTVCSYEKPGGKKLGCVPTVTPSASCAPGVICQVDGKGNPICLKRDNHLSTSGVVVTIVFSVGILGASAAILIAHYQSRSVNKKAEIERTALLSGTSARNVGKARAVDVENSQSYQQNPSDAHVPLISPGGTRADQAYQHPYNTDYFNAPGGSNSVSPGEGRGAAPKLHPGLGALGQDTIQ